MRRRNSIFIRKCSPGSRRAPVVIRTLDLGSDKQAPYFGIDNEDNPAMGYRAIRICLKGAAHFPRPAARVAARASVYGNLNVMFPMITPPRTGAADKGDHRRAQGGA